jgi:hypothetical protein
MEKRPLPDVCLRETEATMGGADNGVRRY